MTGFYRALTVPIDKPPPAPVGTAPTPHPRAGDLRLEPASCEFDAEVALQFEAALLRLAWNEHKRRRIRGVLGSGGRPDELRRSHPHPGGQMKLVPGFHAVAEYERASGRQLRRVPRTAALRDRCFYRRARARRRARGEATPVPLSPCTRTPWHGRFHVACVCPFGSCATHLGVGRASHVDRAAAREVPTLHSCLSRVLAVSLEVVLSYCPITPPVANLCHEQLPQHGRKCT